MYGAARAERICHKKKHRDLVEAPTHARQVFTGSDLEASFCVSVYGVTGT